MINDNFNRNYSTSKSKEKKRKSLTVTDLKYEFNAPKYFDLSKENFPNDKK